MTKLLANVLLLIAFTAVAARADFVDAYIEDFLASRHIPGAAVLVIRNGRIVKNRGYGFADLETRTPATSGTVFEIGSMTKQFTAASVMLLAERGLLSLDDPVTKFFPDAPAAWRLITVRHLLSHTSGIRNHVAVPGYMDLFRTSVTGRVFPDRGELLAEFFRLPLEFEPGESWAYDNTGYILLGLIIEKTSGKSYWEFLNESIFVPAGMKSTRSTDPTKVIGNRASGYAWIGKEWENRPALPPHVAFSAGSLVSTVGDISKWDAALAAGTIIPRRTLETMRTPTRLNDGSTAPFDYGYGWFADRLRGHRMIVHNGGTPGFSSILVQFPEDRLAVVILANHADTILETAAIDIAAHFLPDLKPRPERTEPGDAAAGHSRIFKALLRGGFDPERFTPPMVLHLRSATGKGLFGWYGSLGEFSGFRPIDRERHGELDVVRYLGTFSGKDYRFTFKTDRSGRIVQILPW